MGIKNLTSLLKELNPDILKSRGLDYFKGKRVALDISIYINKYVATNRENWTTMLAYLLMNLRYNDIEVIIIFDGKNVPIEKEMERESRKLNRLSTANRCDKMQNLYDRIMISFFDKKGNTRIVDNATINEFKALFARSRVDFNSINLEDPEELVIFLREKIEKAKMVAEGVLPIHRETAKSLVRAMGFSYIQAYGEAEALCSSLAFRGYVEAVISTDSDCLAYGAPILITDIKAGKWEFYRLKDVLRTLQLKFHSFVDLCIALGCDYNKNMKGCGKKTAYKCIQQYGSLDNWEAQESHKSFEILRYPTCRKYFRAYSDAYIQKCVFKTPGNADIAELDKIFSETGSHYKGQYVYDVQQKLHKPGLWFSQREEPDMLGDIEAS